MTDSSIPKSMKVSGGEGRKRGLVMAAALIVVAGAACLAATSSFGGLYPSRNPVELEGGRAAGAHSEGGGGGADARHEAHKHRVRGAHGSLAHLQRLVKVEERKEGSDRAEVVSTEDAYVAARAHSASIEAEKSDESEDLRKLALERKNDETRVKGSLLARKKAVSRLAERQNAAKKALEVEQSVFKLENRALSDKDASEKDEAEGIAIQEPAASLLKDSQKLNDQSNLVLDQSKSAQAKALAALDLNLAQSLATRASEGMSSAKDYFSRAIAARKKAVAADDAAASQITGEAKASLVVNHEVPELLHVLHGQDTGESAIRHVVDADERSVNDASARLGEDREAVRSAYEARSLTLSQIVLAKNEAGLLRKELVAAQKAVVVAAKQHVAASQRYKGAQLAMREAEDNADDLEGKVRGNLQQQLKAAEDAGEEARRRFKEAKDKVEALDGRQTLLKMQVARLKLQLKESDIKGDSARAEARRERGDLSEVQTQLDKEDGELNEARLRLADASIGDEGASSTVTALRARSTSRGRHTTTGVHAEAAQAEEEAEGGGDDVLERERAREREMRKQQAMAEVSARSEERRLVQAQKEVQAQMAKVRSLESAV